MNILIIPEDFRNDQYILKPLFKRLLEDLGKPRAKVLVCQNPMLGGIGEALKLDRLRQVCEMYSMVDIFILCVDRDGVAGRRERLTQLEGDLSTGRIFLAENAWEEIETWVLAGLDLPNEWAWSEIRAEVSVKEVYFEPLAERSKVSDGPGGGRRHFGELAARKLDAIMLKCPTDFGVLAMRLKQTLDSFGQ